MIFTPPPALRARWAMSASLAGLAHVAVVGAFLIEIRPKADVLMPPQAAMAVEMAAVAEAPAAPPKEVAPGPDQVQAEKPQPVEKPDVKLPFDPPPAITVADAKPEVVLPAKTEPRKVVVDKDLPPAPDTTQRAALDIPEKDKLAAPITEGLASGKTSHENSWEARVLAKVSRLKRYAPEAQRLRQQDRVVVRVVFDRQGRLLAITPQSSRGFALLDREAVDVMRRASPVPPPPADVEGERITRDIAIDFFLSKR